MCQVHPILGGLGTTAGTRIGQTIEADVNVEGIIGVSQYEYVLTVTAFRGR